MNIHIASPHEWQKFRDIRLTGMQTDPQAFGGDLTEEMERLEPEWRKRLESDDRFFFVMEEDDIFISMAGAKKISDKMWMLVGVYTRFLSRGKGLAEQLTHKIIVECKRRECDIIQLMVNVDQKDAVHIYKKLGFETIKTMKDEKMTDGQLHDVCVMEKKLV
jgi:predicted GNAT family acetyltransferase